MDNECCLGIKTGVTRNAGNCLATYFVKNGKRFIVIILGCISMEARFKESELLYNWVYKNYDYVIGLSLWNRLKT